MRPPCASRGRGACNLGRRAPCSSSRGAHPAECACWDLQYCLGASAGPEPRLPGVSDIPRLVRVAPQVCRRACCPPTLAGASPRSRCAGNAGLQLPPRGAAAALSCAREHILPPRCALPFLLRFDRTGDWIPRVRTPQVRQSINADDAHFPRTALCVLENTTNKGGGAVYSLTSMRQISQVREQPPAACCSLAQPRRWIQRVGAPPRGTGQMADMGEGPGPRLRATAQHRQHPCGGASTPAHPAPRRSAASRGSSFTWTARASSTRWRRRATPRRPAPTPSSAPCCRTGCPSRRSTWAGCLTQSPSACPRGWAAPSARCCSVRPKHTQVKPCVAAHVRALGEAQARRLHRASSAAHAAQAELGCGRRALRRGRSAHTSSSSRLRPLARRLHGLHQAGAPHPKGAGRRHAPGGLSGGGWALRLGAPHAQVTRPRARCTAHCTRCRCRGRLYAQAFSPILACWCVAPSLPPGCLRTTGGRGAWARHCRPCPAQWWQAWRP